MTSILLFELTQFAGTVHVPVEVRKITTFVPPLGRGKNIVGIFPPAKASDEKNRSSNAEK
jgi:hypothetical protein